MHKLIFLMASSLVLVTVVTLPIQSNSRIRREFDFTNPNFTRPVWSTPDYDKLLKKGDFKQPDFVTEGDCNDQCTNNPKAVCKLDCWKKSDGQKECQNNFYLNGKRYYHCYPDK